MKEGRLRSEAGQTAAEYLGVLLVVSVIIGSIIASDIGVRVASATTGAVCRIGSTGCEEPAPATEEQPAPATTGGGVHGSTGSGIDQLTAMEQQDQLQQQLLNSDDADEQMAAQLQLQQLQEMIQLINQIMQQQEEMANQIISNVR